MNEDNKWSKSEIDQAILLFGEKSGLRHVTHDLKTNSNGDTLVLRIVNPTERFFGALEAVRTNRDPLSAGATIKRHSPNGRLQTAEAGYFAQVLSESLNINRLSFPEDFFSRYTRSISNAEAQILSASNHIVQGRRGAGKSSLLLYCLRTREQQSQPSVWLDMQTYEKRTDLELLLDVVEEILRQMITYQGPAPLLGVIDEINRMKTSDRVNETAIRQLAPRIRRATTSSGSIRQYIFLDDFHVIPAAMQPKLLGFIYSFVRGNNIFLKISAIESLTSTWDAKNHMGLQVPNDAQTIKLDYNLTVPEKAAEHIEGILDAHAVYCGLPSVRFLCNSNDVISRLVWVSAGVPRDALNMFTIAMNKGINDKKRHVTVSHVNMAASEMVTQKMRDIGVDAPGDPEQQSLKDLLDQVRDFCISKNQKNAFLVEVQNESELYSHIRTLIDLRLVHVISEGVTIRDAGRKYLALILDYGFYTGIRAAQSVDLFNKQSKKVTWGELRTLPEFKD